MRNLLKPALSTALLLTGALSTYQTSMLHEVKAATIKTTYLKSSDEKEGHTYLITALLNLRESDSSSSTILATIPKGTTVTSSHTTKNGWYEVEYKGQTGYVSGKYMKKYEKEEGYQFIDVRTSSPVTAKQINDYIADFVDGRKSVLTGKGQAFINSGKKYGINALFLAAHAIHESGYGMSNISIGKKNLFGYGAYDVAPYVGAYKFASVEDCIDYVARKLKYDYLNPDGRYYEGPFLGYRTHTSKGARVAEKSVGMNYWYASDVKWGEKISKHMEGILPYNEAYYTKAKINTTVPSFPGIPAGSETFPAKIKAKTKQTLGTIKKGATFTLLKKSNDYRLKVDYKGKEFWTERTAFSSYNKYFAVLNLGRVTSEYVNIRPEASTKKKAIGKLTLNKYVALVLDKKDKPIMDKTKKWYKIYLSNGKTGWVSSMYIQRELK